MFRFKSLTVIDGRRVDIHAKYPNIKFANTAVHLVGTFTTDEEFEILVAFGGKKAVLIIESDLGWTRMYVRTATSAMAYNNIFETDTNMHGLIVSVAFGGALGVLLRSHIHPHQQASWENLLSCMRKILLMDDFMPKSVQESARLIKERVTRQSLRALHDASLEAAARRRELVMRLAHWR